MSFAICLDPNSTNFSLSTLSSNGFNIYADTGAGFTILVASGIPALDLFPPPVGNCPYLATLPQGTLQILVVDVCNAEMDVTSIFNPANVEAGTITTECCYAIIPIPQGTPPVFCETCPLVFDIFPTTNIGIITAGNLTSTCGPVTDYVIGWYLNGNYSAPVITSGFGSTFSSYQFTHPLTGPSSVPVLAGNWEGIIHDIKINGAVYSSISGSGGGQLIPFSNCFDTIVVNPLQCNNGPFQGIAKYVHQITFNSQAVGTTSAPVSITYALNPTTKHFAYYFAGYNIADEIEIKWKSGDASVTTNPSLYAQSIYLEKINIGNNITTANLPNSSLTINNIWPKSLQTSETKRVLTLTNLETSSNPLAPDLLEITITPNLGSNNTNWKAGFTCLDDFICGDCDFESYPDNLPAINQIRLEKLYGCPSQRIRLNVSGCLGSGDWMTQGDPLTSLNGSLIGATKGLSNNTSTFYNNFTPLFPISSCNEGQYLNTENFTCAPSNNNTITLTKSVGSLKIEFNNISDYNDYKNNLILRGNQLIGQSPAITTTPVVCNSALPIPQLLQYYRFITLKVPIQSINADCGDNSQQYYYKFHINDYFNITYTETPASNYFCIDIPQTIITDCYPPTGCDSCYSLVSAPLYGIVAYYNNQVLTSGPNILNTGSPIFTTNVGAKYVFPFSGQFLHNYSQSPEGTGSACATIGGAANTFNWYNTTTMPFIPDPTSPGAWVNLTTLSAPLSCPLIYPPQFIQAPFHNIYYQAYTSFYQSKFLNLSSSFNYNFNGGQSTNDFELYTLTGLGAIGSVSSTNLCPQNPADIIFSYIGGVSTVIQPNFFINGAPTVIIDP